MWRADIVLATADGLGTVAIMRRTGKSKPCVWRWQERYVAEGAGGLLRDKTRPSRKKPFSAEVKLKVLTKTAKETPANATHWSARSMAKEAGIGHTSVQRIWAEAGLKPAVQGIGATHSPTVVCRRSAAGQTEKVERTGCFPP
jgi:transposase